jgi:hypothetical protein
LISQRTMTSKLSEILENEWYLVRYSGETPEIALHSAIFHLSEDQDGPKIHLDHEQLAMLKKAAADRFSEIILRDLQHVNIGSKAYRGIGRAIVNFKRFLTFCERQKYDPEPTRRQTAAAFSHFMATEIAVVSSGMRQSIVNCSYKELLELSNILAVNLLTELAAIRPLLSPPE